MVATKVWLFQRLFELSWLNGAGGIGVLAFSTL